MSSVIAKSRNGFLASIALGMAMLLFGAQAFATTPTSATPANAQLKNTVTVSYQSTAGGAVTTTSASVSITVNLVKVAATVGTPTTNPSSVGSTANLTQGTQVTIAYQVTTNANGPDTYTFAAPALAQTNNATGGSISPSTTQSVALGATAVGEANTLTAVCEGTTGTTPCTITVPNDTVGGSANSVNGIGSTTVDQYVEISTTSGAIYCIVPANGVTNATSGAYVAGTNDATINVQQCGASIAYSFTSSAPTISGAVPTSNLSIGDPILQTAFQTYAVTTGTVSSTATQDYGIQTFGVASLTNTNSPTADSSAPSSVAIYIYAPQLVVHKFVYNTTSANNPTQSPTTCSSGNPCLQIGGVIYFPSTATAATVTASPTDTLNYAELIINAGSTTVSDVVVADPIPVFTSYTAYSASLIGTATLSNTTSPYTGSCTAGNASGTCYIVSGTATTVSSSNSTTTTNGTTGVETLYVSAGSGGTTPTTGSSPTGGGSIPALSVSGGASVVYYSVTAD